MSTQRKAPEWTTAIPAAHRGLHNGAEVPENSLLAFRKACEAGYVIELDVYQVADGGLIVFHDSPLMRLTGAEGKLIEQTTPYLTSLNLLGSDQKIPTFDEALAEINGRSPIWIEVKVTGNVESQASALHDALKNYKGEFVVESFDARPLVYFREHAPQMPRGLISCTYSWIKDPANRPNLVKQLDESAADVLSYDHRDIVGEPQRLTKERGIPLVAWTVTTNEQRDAALENADNYVFEVIRPEIGK